jgi:hypothetical protein
MNRTKLPLPKQLQKKIKKEVRAAQRPLPREQSLLSDSPLATPLLLKKHPKKESLLDASLKRMEIRKKKRLAKKAKRTTPGEVIEDSPPKSVHVEGRRWIKTLELQNLNNAKTMRRKDANRRGKHKP